MIYEIIALIGIIATGTFMWLWNQSRQHYALLEARTLQLQELYIQEQALKAKLQVQLDNTQSEYHSLERDYAVLHTRNEENTRAFEEKIRLLDEAKAQMKVQFEQLATQIFEQKAKTFDEAHTKGLDGENKTQGNWGEIVLERILEESGLRKGHEYEIQSTLSDEDGKKFRPDVIVHLPQNKDIIIDSKVSLVAYDAFIRAETDEERSHTIKQHLLSIHSHIKGLSGKRYEQLNGVRTLDFVLLFMPIEGAFLLALEHDNSFFKSAYEQNIVVVSPSTLLVTLRTIEHIWRSEYQERNAKAIAESAEALYEKLVTFVEDMEKIGEQIGRTQKSYDAAMNKLCIGKGNLIRRVESMRKLGLKPKKLLPSSLIERDDNEEDDLMADLNAKN
ncbi:MAG: DNA recombination protein RmuC [Epsilonproteobacteria bacterium]|nr:DNA recombination protein RmuC [Campylobacterota bacterium]